MNEITDKIFKELKNRKIKITEFAQKMDVSRDTVYKWTDETIRYATIKKIAVYLNLPISHFVNDNNNQKFKIQKPKAKNQLKVKQISKGQIKLINKMNNLKKIANTLKKEVYTLQSELKKELQKFN